MRGPFDLDTIVDGKCVSGLEILTSGPMATDQLL